MLQAMRLFLFTLFTICTGCSSSSGPSVLFLDSASYTKTFDAAVAIANDDGMKPVLLDRRSGVISTDPAIAGSFVEPWKPAPSTQRQGLENTLSLQRRTARFEFSPAGTLPSLMREGGSLIGPDLLSSVGQDLTTYEGPLELRVWIYVDRNYTQGIRRGTWTLSSESVTQIMPSEEPWEQVSGSFWTPITRDVAREEAILAAISASVPLR
jgi:hypothetical protein